MVTSFDNWRFTGISLWMDVREEWGEDNVCDFPIGITQMISPVSHQDELSQMGTVGRFGEGLSGQTSSVSVSCGWLFMMGVRYVRIIHCGCPLCTDLCIIQQTLFNCTFHEYFGVHSPKVVGFMDLFLWHCATIFGLFLSAIKISDVWREEIWFRRFRFSSVFGSYCLRICHFHATLFIYTCCSVLVLPLTVVSNITVFAGMSLWVCVCVSHALDVSCARLVNEDFHCHICLSYVSSLLLNRIRLLLGFSRHCRARKFVTTYNR